MCSVQMGGFAKVVVDPEAHKLCIAAESLLHSFELTCLSCPHMLHMHPGTSSSPPPPSLPLNSSILVLPALSSSPSRLSLLGAFQQQTHGDHCII